ncbi:MAG: endonuclease/exonuclease/phosphatase family protein [Myxococcota bacterium]
MIVATFNVHRWQDARGLDNVGRVRTLLMSHMVDVVGLQEVTDPQPLRRLAADLNLQISKNQYGNAILSRYPLQGEASIPLGERRRHRKGTPRERAICATISVDDQPVRMVVLHLDHVQAETRIAQLEAVRRALGKSLLPELWMGDFNALTRADYSPHQWSTIAAVREKNQWEPPRTVVSEWMQRAGFVDCWTLAGRTKPIATCRFNTRIDYLWASPAWAAAWAVNACHAVPADASDHRMVVADMHNR